MGSTGITFTIRDESLAASAGGVTMFFVTMDFPDLVPYTTSWLKRPDGICDFPGTISHVFISPPRGVNPDLAASSSIYGLTIAGIFIFAVL